MDSLNFRIMKIVISETKDMPANDAKELIGSIAEELWVFAEGIPEDSDAAEGE